ncbi:hypothetical protein L195_g064374, partial [Trifolium pratense]
MCCQGRLASSIEFAVRQNRTSQTQ